MPNDYYLNFRINTTVLTSDGGSISTGAVVSFKQYTNSITPDGKIPCDLRWWYSYDAQTNGWTKISVCTNAVTRIETQLLNAYLQLTVPVEDLTYDIIQGYAQSFLEGIYGSGNIEIIQ